MSDAPFDPPTSPGTPGAKATAAEVAQTAVELRAGNLRMSIPGVLLIAVLTSVSTTTAVRYTAPEGDAQETQRELRAVRKELGEVKATQSQIFDKISVEAQTAANARAVAEAAAATDKRLIEARFAGIEAKIR